MRDYLFDAREDLKRADHMLYVSLKYTRTVDVIRNIIERLVSSMGFVIEGMITKKKRAGKIKEVPASPGLRAEAVRSLYSDEKIIDLIQFYLLLRKIMRAEFTRSQEYRKRVTMTSLVDDQYLKVDVETVLGYYNKTKEFMDYIEESLK